jgi:hypothetical protein
MLSEDAARHWYFAGEVVATAIRAAAQGSRESEQHEQAEQNRRTRLPHGLPPL